MKNIFIISGPAGSGKDALLEKLALVLPFERVITTTTRAPRPGESEGKPYFFLDHTTFKKKIAEGEFIEYSTNENAELYGVTKAEIERVKHISSLIFWKLDWKGTQSVKKIYPTIPALLITAPLDILEARLRKRDGATQNESYFQERMDYTREWMQHLDIYDYIIQNEEGKLDEAVKEVREIIENASIE